MNYSNHNFTPALTIRGVISKCAREKHVGRKIAQCIGGGILVVMIMAMLMGILWLMADPEITVQASKFTEPTKEQVKMAHKRHGIYLSAYDPSTGESYFVRDGKQIRLFAYKEDK